MKTIFFTLFLVAFFVMGAVAQDNTIHLQTSEEEYNYITKGYKIQLESGLDMKMGYVVFGSVSNKCFEYNMEVKTLIKIIGDKYYLCGTMIIFKSENSKNDLYLCLPTNNSDAKIWNMYWSSLSWNNLAVFSNDYKNTHRMYSSLACVLSLHLAKTSYVLENCQQEPKK